MESQDVQPQFTESPKRTMPFLLPVLFLVIVAVVAGYFILTRTPTITGLEVAEKTSLFLDKTLQSDGGMLGGFACGPSATNECRPFKISAVQPHVGQAIYSYFLLAEVTGNQSYREKSDLAVNHVLDICDTDIRMCEWNFFPLAQYYEKTKEEKYLKRGMLRPAEKFLTMNSVNAIFGNVGHKLAALYKATGDVRFKNRLIELADGELKNWPGDDKYLFTAIHVVWSVFLPVYNITGDSKYLLASEEFYDNFKMSENLSKFQTALATPVAVKAVDGLLGLAEISEKRETYRTQAHIVLQELLFKLWDTSESVKFNSDYGFIDSTIPADETNIIDKSTILNGWLVKVFTLMKDDKFYQIRR